MFLEDCDSSDEKIVDIQAIRQRITKSRENMSTKHNNRNKKTHEFNTGNIVAVIVTREDRGYSDFLVTWSNNKKFFRVNSTIYNKYSC